MAGAEEAAPSDGSAPDSEAAADSESGGGMWGWLTSARRWDARHAMVSGGLINAVDSIDRLFGDERLDEDAQKTWIRIRVGVRYSEQDELEALGNFRVRLAMPQMEYRLQLIIDRDVEAEDARSVISLRDRREQPIDAGLRYILKDDERHRFSLDAGVRGTSPVQAFGRARGRLVFPFSKWELRFTESVAWLTADGFEKTTEMRWTRLMRNDWWFRSISWLTWDEVRSGVAPGQSFMTGRQLSDRRAFRVELTGEWPEVPNVRTARYMTEFTYRQRLYKDWLYMEIAPGVDFRQERNFDPNPGISFRCEVIFGDG